MYTSIIMGTPQIKIDRISNRGPKDRIEIINSKDSKDNAEVLFLQTLFHPNKDRATVIRGGKIKGTTTRDSRVPL